MFSPSLRMSCPSVDVSGKGGALGWGVNTFIDSVSIPGNGGSALLSFFGEFSLSLFTLFVSNKLSESESSSIALLPMPVCFLHSRILCLRSPHPLQVVGCPVYDYLLWIL